MPRKLLLLILTARALGAADYDFDLPDDQGEKSEAAEAQPREAVPQREKKLSTADVFTLFQRTGTVSAATKLKQTIYEVPASIMQVSASDFEQFGYMTLNEAVYAQAGFFFSQGTERRTIGSRGLFEDWNNTHYLHLVDGIPLNDNADGSAHTWDATPVIFIRNLEIVRGPGSALYGSNATNGVLSVSTYSGSELGGKTDIRMRYGSLNTHRVEIMTGGANPVLQYVFSYTQSGTSGNDQKIYDQFENSGAVDADGNPILRSVSDERKMHYFSAKLQGNGEWEGLVFQYHRQWYQFGTYDGYSYQVPDQPEEMQQNRDIVSLAFQPKSMGKLHPEALVRYQAYHQNYHLRPVNDGGFSGQYPDGASEVLDYTMHDAFSRLQLGIDLPDRMNWLFGVENTLLYYNGDRAHYANFDPDTPDYLPFLNSQNPNVDPGDENSTRPLKPFMEYILNRPIWRMGAYTQWVSGNLLARYVQITAGLRYDRAQSRYQDINADNQQKEIIFENASPRLGLIILPSNNLSFKLLASQAFRDPAPIELFAVHSWVAASNVEKLKPETVRTAEFIVNWEFVPNLFWQQSAYYTQFNNLISYNPNGTNLLENLYSTETAGGESEFFFNSKWLRIGIGYAYAHRIAQKYLSEALTPVSGLTDAPQHSARANAIVTLGPMLFSLRYAYHGAVKSSSPLSDSSPYFVYRPNSLPAFHDVALRAVYKITAFAEAGVEVRNALDTTQFTVANNDSPYNYRRELRTIYGYVKFSL